MKLKRKLILILPNIIKRIVLTIFLLFQLGIYAQDNSKWTIGVEFSIDNLSISDGRDGIDYLIIDGNINGYAIDFDKNNFSLGLTTNYSITTKLNLSSGLLYSNKDFTGIFNCATCLSFLSVPETIQQRFLTIPISVDYTFSTGKLKPYLQGGFKNNIELKNDLKDQSNGYFLEAFIGASLYYQIYKNWNVGIGYNYQTALSDLYKTDEFNLRTNNLFLKIYYTL